MGSFFKGALIGSIIGVSAMVAMYPSAAQRNARRMLRNGRRTMQHYARRMGM